MVKTPAIASEIGTFLLNVSPKLTAKASNSWFIWRRLPGWFDGFIGVLLVSRMAIKTP
jgi:hypothetical protein